MMDPSWAMVGLILAGQVGGSAWVVAALKGRVDLVAEVAETAKHSADHAHRRIDNRINGRGVHETTS